MPTSQSQLRISPAIHGPEPRIPSKRVSQSVFLLEQTAQGATDDNPRQGRHLKSASAHYYNSDGPTTRKTTYARARSVDPQHRTLAGSGGSAAALKAAQLSANAHHVHEVRANVEKSPTRTKRITPYLAAANKAWSNSAAKLPIDRAVELKQSPKIEVTALSLHAPEHEAPNTRSSSETTRPSHSEFLIPVRSGGRSKSRNSDHIAQELRQPSVGVESHQGPLQAARISFAHDREAHASENKPPSRPASANPQTLQAVISKQTSGPANERCSPPPGRKSVDNSGAALSAASSIWANHEHDQSRGSTPVSESYTYMTHKAHTTLRKTHKEETNKFLKHGRVQPIPSSDRKRYDGLWAGNKGLLFEGFQEYKDDVANVVVRDIWSRSRLQPEILSDIYDLVDRDEKGRLTRDEFVVGTWLVDHSLRGRRLPFKQDLTDDIFDRGYLWRLGISVPKKLKHDEKKYLGTEKRKRH